MATEAKDTNGKLDAAQEEHHEEQRMHHTWTEFFLEPVPISICATSIAFNLGYRDTAAILAIISFPFVLAFLHTLYIKLLKAIGLK